jgi:hypothetical protein
MIAWTYRDDIVSGDVASYFRFRVRRDHDAYSLTLNGRPVAVLGSLDDAKHVAGCLFPLDGFPALMAALNARLVPRRG